jgi:hypothetical protein
MTDDDIARELRAIHTSLDNIERGQRLLLRLKAKPSRPAPVTPFRERLHAANRRRARAAGEHSDDH